MTREPEEPDATAPSFTCALALGVALGLGVLLVVVPAVRLALPAKELSGVLQEQHQSAETLAFVFAFAVVLPLAGFGGHRLTTRLVQALGPQAVLSLAACLLAGLSLVIVAARGAEAAGLGGALVWLLVLAIVWWLAAASVLGWLVTRDVPSRLLPAPRTAWAVAGLLAAGAALTCVKLDSLALVPLASGAVVAVAAFVAANRFPLPRPARTWAAGVDIAVVALLVLMVTGLEVISPEKFSTSFNAVLEGRIIQFHQDFFLGPANQVVHGDAMLVDTFSQYGVGAIYAIAGWFELVPIGNGTLGLLDGLLAALVFASAYAVLRLAGLPGWLAASALAVAVFALVYGLAYPVGALLQHGAIRFGAPIVVLVGATLEARRPGTAPRVLQLVALGISSIWALEAFAYTLVTLAAVVAVRVSMAAPTARRSEVARWLVGAAVACLIAHLLLVGLTLILAGALPDWGRYLDTLREFLSGRIGDITYDFAPWSPALLVAALYFCSALALALLIRLRPAVVEANRVAVTALAGSTAYGVALFSYFVNRSGADILPYISLPAVLVVALWLHLLRPAGVGRRQRSLAFATAAAAATLMVAAAWSGAGDRFSESALAYAAPGGKSLGGALDRLGDLPPLLPEAPGGVQLLDEEMPGEQRSVVLTDADLAIEILWRADRASALPFGDPWEDSFVPEQHVAAVSEAVSGLQAGDRLLIDKPGSETFRGYLAEPERDPIEDPFGQETLVPTGVAALQELALKEIGLRFRLRTVAGTPGGLRVVELVPRRPSCPEPKVRRHSSGPWRRRAASSSPRVAPLRIGSCVLARHPPVPALGATGLPTRDTRSALVLPRPPDPVTVQDEAHSRPERLQAVDHTGLESDRGRVLEVAAAGGHLADPKAEVRRLHQELRVEAEVG